MSGEVTCPNCKAAFAGDAGRHGLLYSCPHCGFIFDVPEPAGPRSASWRIGAAALILLALPFAGLLLLILLHPG